MLIWPDRTPQAKIDKIAGIAFREIFRPTAINSADPRFMRIVGQSGSGKSTQVLPAVLSANPNSVIVAVRNFTKYFRNRTACREKSNGFCLRVLTKVLSQLIAARSDIILDMTLLPKRYEKQLLKRLQNNNYRSQYFILAVHKRQSDAFVKRREAETGRTVARKSIRCFYNWLEPSLRYIAKHDPAAKCVIWSAYALQPIYYGDIDKGLPAFRKTRKELRTLPHSKEEMLDAKIKFLADSYMRYN
jgi:predicted kinase